MKNLVLIAAIILYCLTSLSVNGYDKYNIGYNVDDTTEYAQFATHVVHSGDTFWNIAEYYCNKDERKLYIHEYLDEMRRINPHLKGRQYQLQPNDLVHVIYVGKKADL